MFRRRRCVGHLPITLHHFFFPSFATLANRLVPFPFFFFSVSCRVNRAPTPNDPVPARNNRVQFSVVHFGTVPVCCRQCRSRWRSVPVTAAHQLVVVGVHKHSGHGGSCRGGDRCGLVSHGSGSTATASSNLSTPPTTSRKVFQYAASNSTFIRVSSSANLAFSPCRRPPVPKQQYNSHNNCICHNSSKISSQLRCHTRPWANNLRWMPSSTQLLRPCRSP